MKHAPERNDKTYSKDSVPLPNTIEITGCNNSFVQSCHLTADIISFQETKVI